MIIEATKGFYKDKVNIKWEAVVGAEKYIIFRKNLSIGTISQIGETTLISFDDLTVIPKTVYVYFVVYVIGDVVSDLVDNDIGYADIAIEEKENNFFIQEYTDTDLDIIFCFNNEIFESDIVTIKAINCTTNQEIYVDNINCTKIEKNFVKWNTVNIPIKPKNSKILLIANIANTNKKSTIMLEIKDNESVNSNSFVNADFGKLTF